MLHMKACRGVRMCLCAAYQVMHPGTDVFMVVWDYADLMLLGGLPTDGRVLLHILSVDVAVLHMVKFGGTTVTSLGQLAEVTCTLEEAFFKIIGMTPSSGTNTNIPHLKCSCESSRTPFSD